jgi:AraC-like DNA-binding protein
VQEHSPAPIDRIIYAGARVTIGAFRCPVTHPRFHDSGPAQGDIFVFPRTRVTIQHTGACSFTADPHTVTLYNKGQRYRRDAVSPDGDRCDWFRVERSLVLETVRELDSRAEDCSERPFRFTHGPSDAVTYLAQRELFQRLASGVPADSLEVEEAVVDLLARVLRQTYRALEGVAPPDADAPLAEAEIVERARLALAKHYDEAISLAAIAAACGVSHFRLCRAFRKRTGTTLHAYREQLRLRTALEALASPRADLTDLALSLGYSSHSHFSANFRAAFGMTPSDARHRATLKALERIPHLG